MAYRASNGILTAHLTDEEAAAHYAAAEIVQGHFGGRFVTAIVGENSYGQRIVTAETWYVPLDGEDIAAIQGTRMVDLAADELAWS